MPLHKKMVLWYNTSRQVRTLRIGRLRARSSTTTYEIATPATFNNHITMDGSSFIAPLPVPYIVCLFVSGLGNPHSQPKEIGLPHTGFERFEAPQQSISIQILKFTLCVYPRYHIANIGTLIGPFNIVKKRRTSHFQSQQNDSEKLLTIQRLCEQS